MEEIKEAYYDGERPLYGLRDAQSILLLVRVNHH